MRTMQASLISCGQRDQRDRMLSLRFKPTPGGFDCYFTFASKQQAFVNTCPGTSKAPGFSCTSTALKHHRNSQCNEFEVLPDRLLLKIGNIHLYHFVKGYPAASIDLPCACQPRFSIQL